jgi:uncharacterized membrane protein
MPSCMPLLAMFLLLFGSVLAEAQTATCTNWTFFKLPSPWVGTEPGGINRWGTVVGQTSDPSGIPHGFIRYSNGAIKAYNAPIGFAASFTRRNALGITVGWTVGTQRYYGLVLDPSVNVSGVYGYPGASNTRFTGINYWGTIVGLQGPFGSPDGFKLKNGIFTLIQYPGAATTTASSISDKGVIVGWYANAQSGGGLRTSHGFTLANGAYKTLDNPAGSDTFLNDINGGGVIVGNYQYQGNSYGFIYINSTFKNITAPNALRTTVAGINGYGYITGTATMPTAELAYTAHCQ